MVWKNSKVDLDNVKARRVAKKKKNTFGGGDKIKPKHIPLYSKNYKMTKDDLADNRVKPSFLERMQARVRVKVKKKKIRTIIDGAFLRTHTLFNPVEIKKQKKFSPFILFTCRKSREFQAPYLQGKMYKREKSLLNRFHSETLRIKYHRIFQYKENYNKFTKHFNYKGLLFRSFWFSKFISTLVLNGKKQLVWRKILQVFSELKFEFGRNPVMLLFEILELYRMPLKALQPKNKTKKSIVRTHIVSWWKQYTQLMQWMRHTVRTPTKTTFHWEHRIKSEMNNLLLDASHSLIKKRLELNAQMIAFSKISLHFRWYRRFSRRAARAVKVIDKRFYE